jgi:hypothetical protein
MQAFSYIRHLLIQVVFMNLFCKFTFDNQVLVLLLLAWYNLYKIIEQ